MSDSLLIVRGVAIVGGPSVWLRGLKVNLSKTLEECVRRWHRWFLPQHFEPGAVQRYGYKSRKEKYLKRNRGKGYIVRSGLTRTQATRAIFIRSGPKRATGKMFVPSYITRRLRDKDRPDLAAEIKRVSSREHKELREFVRQTLLPKMRAAVWRGEVRISA